MQLDVYKKYKFLFIAAVFVTGIIIYFNSFGCSFHFDDAHIFKANVTNGSATIMDWLRIFPSRPVGMLTFALDYQVHKLDIWGYHFVNLMIHLINAFLVWWLTRLTLSTPVMRDETIAKYKTLIAFLVAMLFVSHPLATQSVTYIAQRFASLATLFYFLSLILFVEGRLRQIGRTAQVFIFGGSLLCALLGMRTKEMVFTLPFAIFLYDYCFIRTTSWKIELRDKSLYVLLIMMGMFVILSIKNFSPSVFDSVPPFQGYTYSISAKEYLLTQFNVITTYIRLFALPVNQNLDYDYPISYSLLEVKTLLCFSLLLGILATGIIFFKKYRLISFGIFWFFLTISVESSVIPISQNVIFEHRTYLPGFGFFLAVTGAFFYFFRERYLVIGVIIILMFAGSNAILTYQRNKVWENEYTLWTDCVKKSPNKARPHDNLGAALHYMGRDQEAISHYKIAVKLSPGYDNPYFNLGTALRDQGNMEEAVSNFRKALEINPRFVGAHNNWGLILEQYYKKHDEAIYHYQQEIKINPDSYYAHYNLGIALVRKGELKEAVVHLRKAVYLKPDSQQALSALRLAVENEQRH